MLCMIFEKISIKILCLHEFYFVFFARKIVKHEVGDGFVGFSLRYVGGIGELL